MDDNVRWELRPWKGFLYQPDERDDRVLTNLAKPLRMP
jgi:hypothetical protein